MINFRESATQIVDLADKLFGEGKPPLSEKDRNKCIDAFENDLRAEIARMMKVIPETAQFLLDNAVCFECDFLARAFTIKLNGIFNVWLDDDDEGTFTICNPGPLEESLEYVEDAYEHFQLNDAEILARVKELHTH